MRPIMTPIMKGRYFVRKSERNYYLTQKFDATIFRRPYFSPRPQIMTLFQLSTSQFQLYPRKEFFYNLYWLCRLFLPIADTTDYLIIGTDYEYGRCIGTALL